jgi:hypothetical protein
MSAAEKIEIELEYNFVMPGAWFREQLLPTIFGISTEAARKYRARGKWLEGKHYRTDPANVIVYNKEAIEKWMAGQP